jgi:two-component system sensor histidine kinase BarA
MLHTLDPTLPSVDWKQAQKFNLQADGLSEELFSVFMRQLPLEQAAIIQAFHEKNWVALGELLHKFHGSCVYCGLPRLKSLAMVFIAALKQDQEPGITLLEAFNREVEQVKMELKNKGLG